MKSKKILQIIRCAILIEIGLAISSMGTALFYSADLGSSAMATFCDGLHLLINTSYGTANTLANVVLLVVLFALDKKYIGIGTILCVFTIGPWVNLFMSVLEPLNLNTLNIVIRVLLTVCGASLMGVGLGIYMSVNKGFGALEGIVKFICKKYKVEVKTAKVVQDLVLVVCGIILGAQWGIGTIVGIFLCGPVLQKSNLYFSQIFKSKFLDKESC